MKKILAIALFMTFLGIAATAQTTETPKQPDTINKLNAAGLKTGYWEEKAADNISKGMYDANKKIGTWVTYFSNNNQLYRLESYNNAGQRHGIFLTFDRKNRIQAVEYYKDGLYHGTSIIYGSTNEFPVSETSYVNGKRQGITRIYYDNGKIQEEDRFTDDQKDGVSRWYNRSGKLLAEYTYKAGVFDGPQKTYYENDSLQSVSNYSSNQMNGDYKEFYRNGRIKVSGKYLNGQKDGPWMEFDETGKATLTKKFKNGVAK